MVSHKIFYKTGNSTKSQTPPLWQQAYLTGGVCRATYLLLIDKQTHPRRPIICTTPEISLYPPLPDGLSPLPPPIPSSGRTQFLLTTPLRSGRILYSCPVGNSSFSPQPGTVSRWHPSTPQA